MTPTLLLAEHNGTALSAATLKALTAAHALSTVEVLVCGQGCEAVAREAAGYAGVSRVLLAEADHLRNPLAETLAPFLKQLAGQRGFTHVAAAATALGKDVLPRAAALLDANYFSDVVKILSPSQFVRPIYAGNALESVESHTPVNVITVRASAFAPAEKSASAAEIEALAAPPANAQSAFVSRESVATGRPELASARVVVAGGRGVGSKENFVLLERVADKLGAALAASRAAVDAGYAPNDWQVGQTGKAVAPELYIAAGISGAIQHVAGMKESRVIVAINKDENAAIFEVADYGIVGDLHHVLAELERLL